MVLGWAPGIRGQMWPGKARCLWHHRVAPWEVSACELISLAPQLLQFHQAVAKKCRAKGRWMPVLSHWKVGSILAEKCFALLTWWHDFAGDSIRLQANQGDEHFSGLKKRTGGVPVPGVYIHLIHNLTNEVMLVKPISGEIIRYFSRRFRLRSPSSIGRVRQEPIRNQSWDIYSEEREASNINWRKSLAGLQSTIHFYLFHRTQSLLWFKMRLTPSAYWTYVRRAAPWQLAKGWEGCVWKVFWRGGWKHAGLRPAGACGLLFGVGSRFTPKLLLLQTFGWDTAGTCLWDAESKALPDTPMAPPCYPDFRNSWGFMQPVLAGGEVLVYPRLNKGPVL